MRWEGKAIASFQKRRRRWLKIRRKNEFAVQFSAVLCNIWCFSFVLLLLVSCCCCCRALRCTAALRCAKNRRLLLLMRLESETRDETRRRDDVPGRARKKSRDRRMGDKKAVKSSPWTPHQNHSPSTTPRWLLGL